MARDQEAGSPMKSETTTTRPRRSPRLPRLSSAPASGAAAGIGFLASSPGIPRGAPARRPQRTAQGLPTASGRQLDDGRAVLGAQERRQAEAAAEAGGEHAESGRCGQGELALLPGMSAEIHRGGQVDDGIRGQLPIGDQVTDVGNAGARRDRPVHPADVITEAVFAALSALAAVAGEQA